MLIGLLCCSCQSGVYRRPSTNSSTGDAAILQQLLDSFDEEEVQQHIIALTSPAYEGRAVGTEGEQKAASYLETQLANWQLEPWTELGLPTHIHKFKVPDTDLVGHNVIAIHRGTSDRWLLLVAHYDHLGVKEGRLYPGADDNAVAVAILLEVSRCLATGIRAPVDNVAFVFTSGEEMGLSGSRALANKIREGKLASRCRVVNLDMLGGIGGSSLDVWCESSRPSAKKLATQTRRAIQAAGLKSKRVRKRFGAVDSRAFAEVGMPSVTLSWAYEAQYHPHRHRTSDSWEQLEPAILQRAGRAVLQVTWALANMSD